MNKPRKKPKKTAPKPKAKRKANYAPKTKVNRKRADEVTHEPERSGSFF